VLRGLMTGLDVDRRWSAPVAPGLPQGSMVVIEDRVERVVHLGAGKAPS
jgi:probable phosphoglycerate mutase